MHPDSTTPKPFSPFVIFLFASIATGLTAYFLSGDWACGILAFALHSGIVAILFNALAAFLNRRRARKNPATRPWRKKQQIILLLLLTTGAIVWSLFSASAVKTHMFVVAFECPPPPAITDLTVDSHYAGGPGDMICFIHFHASRETIAQIIAHRPLKKQDAKVAPYLSGDEDWLKFWDRTFGLMSTHYHPAWSIVPEMKQPELYRWSSFDTPSTTTFPITSILLLWDATTQETYIIYSAG